MDFEKEYQEACIKDTDMHEHLPIISELSSQCSHATEFGVGWAQSTRGFLRNDLELHSYEFQPLPGIREFFADARAAGRNVTLHVEDIRKIIIEPTDILLVDSYHSYDQVKTELELHADKVRKYILFHDTTLYGDVGQGGEKGIWPAITEYMEKHPEWQFVERRTNNNGLTIYKRV